ncbi:rhomboid family intramembrane serine protease [Kitasatospora sp. NPDC059571]|uniref:rhomboid family intramembrane serine protease n=1 Tax=Kitasatospora sp. NPDC059571 TaxID=3346871 RepID=UPI0036B5F947
MDQSPPAEPAAPPAAVCFRHSDRESYIRCTRCDRYACPDCRREASVGYQCVDCVKGAAREARPTVTRFGGRATTVPVATWTLIALNVLAYLAELVRTDVVDRFSALGQAVVGPDGGYYTVTAPFLPPGYHAIGIAHGEWYRLITSAFLHLPPTQGLFGILHIAGNMYWVWLLGRLLEGWLGRLRFLGLYLVSALGGSVFQYLLAPHQPAIGASGAVFGLTAGYVVLARRIQYDPLGSGQLLRNSLIWLVISAGFTSWQGHLGGLVAGAAVGAALAFGTALQGRQRAAVQAGGTAAVAVVLVAVVLLRTSDLLANTPWS